MINLDNISFDHCIKCTVCTIYCPVAKVTHLYPGPKQSGPDTERLRIKNPELLDSSLKYCSNCKRCEIACPSGVKIADIIQSAKWKYSQKKFNLRDFLLSHTDLMGYPATWLSPLINPAVRLKPAKAILDRVLKIPSQRKFPAYDKRTFRHWYKSSAPDQDRFKDHVVYFHGCFVNYNFHQLGRDLIRVLNAMGTGVRLTSEKCCGVPLIANGNLQKARQNARFNVNSLTRAIQDTDMRIVATSSSCSLALIHEYPNLLEVDNSNITRRFDYITRYLYRRFESGDIPPMKPLALTVAYHKPCHLERLGGVMHTIGVLKKIPGVKLKLLHSECCGISGTYGFKKEYYRISQDVGRQLADRIQAAAPDLVVTDCETCKWQIEMNTPYPVIHPVSLLAMALQQ